MASLVTRIRYRGNCPVTVHESMVTSVQKRMEPRRSLLGASVDVTEARKASAFGRFLMPIRICVGYLIGIVGRFVQSV